MSIGSTAAPVKLGFLKPIHHILFGLAIALIIGFVSTPYMGIAALAYFVMVTGVLTRKGDKKLHAKFMATAMALDVSLVLILEIQRGAINTASQFSLSGLQQTHIIMSTLAVLLYFPVALIGYKRLTGQWKGMKSRLWHIRLAWSAFIFRSLGFLLMFTLLDYYAQKAAL